MNTEGVRTALAMVGLMGLGFWLGSGKGVRAAADEPFFELGKVEASSALLVYQPAPLSIAVEVGGPGAPG